MALDKDLMLRMWGGSCHQQNSHKRLYAHMQLGRVGGTPHYGIRTWRGIVYVEPCSPASSEMRLQGWPSKKAIKGNFTGMSQRRQNWRAHVFPMSPLDKTALCVLHIMCPQHQDNCCSSWNSANPSAQTYASYQV